jgi:hypothetical protein
MSLVVAQALGEYSALSSVISGVQDSVQSVRSWVVGLPPIAWIAAALVVFVLIGWSRR